jgi:3-isopropylmalate dehydratase
MADADAGGELEVDLEKQVVVRPDGAEIAFDVDPFRKNCLLNGLDDIGLTLQKKDKIATFEESRSVSYPWLDGAGYAERKAVAA